MVWESEAMMSSYNVMIVSTEGFDCAGFDTLIEYGGGGGVET